MAIPLTILILYGGILYFCLSWIPFVSLYLSLGLHYLSHALNIFTALMSRLPGAVTGDLSITMLMVPVIYSVILFIALCLERRDAVSLRALLITLLLCIMTSTFTRYRKLRHPEILPVKNISVYNKDNQSDAGKYGVICSLESF